MSKLATTSGGPAARAGELVEELSATGKAVLANIQERQERPARLHAELEEVQRRLSQTEYGMLLAEKARLEREIWQASWQTAGAESLDGGPPLGGGSRWSCVDEETRESLEVFARDLRARHDQLAKSVDGSTPKARADYVTDRCRQIRAVEEAIGRAWALNNPSAWVAHHRARLKVPALTGPVLAKPLPARTEIAEPVYSD